MEKPSISSDALTGRTPKQGNTRRRGNRASRVPEIVAASLGVLLTAGYAGYSVTEVANKSGILLSTLQHYFPTRAQLLIATLKEFTDRQLARCWDIANNVLLSPHQRLGAIVDLFVSDFNARDTSRLVVEVWALSENEQFAAEFVEDTATQFQKMFEKILHEGSPTMSVEERSIRAAMITAHAHGLIIFMRHSGSNPPDVASLIRGTKAVWQALAL